MKLFGINFGKEQKPVEEVKVKIADDTPVLNPVEAFSFAIQNEYIPPTSSYQEYNGLIRWGYNNLFPLQLADLYNSSPIHSSITLQKSLMIIGEGIKYNDALLSGLTPMQTAELNRFESFADGCEKSLQQIATELELDYQIFGQFAIEVCWNTDFTKIIKINRLPMVNVRLRAEDENGKVQEIEYNKDWTRPSYYGTSVIPMFNIMNQQSQNQVLFVKNPSLDGRYYGTPTYASALNWIASDAAISKFHLSNISHGMSPSLSIKFYKKPESPEQRNDVVRNIEREYSSQKNAGKAMIFFSDGKELAPDVEPIQVNNIDKQFTVIAEQIVEQIVRGHRAVSGILFGIQTIARITAINEYEDAFHIFEKTVLSSDRKVLEHTLNRILKINGLNVGLQFEPFQVFNIQTQKQ